MKPHNCSICDFSFYGIQQLKESIELVHEKKGPNNCSICDFRFSQKGHLKKHLQSIHEEKK